MLAGLKEALSYHLGELTSLEYASGGDTCSSYVASGPGSLKYFVKVQGDRKLQGMLRSEARSLDLLRQNTPLVVPEVVSFGAFDDNIQFLALEWLHPRQTTPMAWRKFGEGLATLHLTSSTTFGLPWNTFVGKWLQDNTASDDWKTFYCKQRLIPLMAQVSGHFRQITLECWDHLIERIGDLLPTENPALIHGDLWSGNVHFSLKGSGLVDPSTYYGHREMDLAMLELFGTVPQEFKEAYQEIFPLEPGFEDRKELYQVFYLLLHVHMFGTSYVTPTAHIIERFK